MYSCVCTSYTHGIHPLQSESSSSNLVPAVMKDGLKLVKTLEDVFEEKSNSVLLSADSKVKRSVCVFVCVLYVYMYVHAYLYMFLVNSSFPLLCAAHLGWKGLKINSQNSQGVYVHAVYCWDRRAVCNVRTHACMYSHTCVGIQIYVCTYMHACTYMYVCTNTMYGCT